MVALGVLCFAAFLTLLYFSRKDAAKLGKAEEQNEALKKNVEIKDEQLEIASKPSLDLADLVKRMRSKGGL